MRGTARAALALVVMKSHGGGSLALCAFVEGKAVGTCKVLLRLPPSHLHPPPSCGPASSPLLSVLPSFLHARMPATKLATPVITTRVAAEAVVVERVLYAARTELRKEGRREERTSERTYDPSFCWQRGQWGMKMLQT